MQHHEILRYDDPDRIFGEGGAMEAFEDARQAGKIRYIGFTGHKDPRIHLQMLAVAAERGFHFDAVQMPLNVMDAHFRSFAHLVLPYLIEHGIAVLGMKAFADSVLLKSGAPILPIEYLHYALNLPTSVVITGMQSQARPGTRRSRRCVPSSPWTRQPWPSFWRAAGPMRLQANTNCSRPALRSMERQRTPTGLARIPRRLRAWLLRCNNASERKAFFFEKKKQKTFDYSASVSPDRLRPESQKFFWFFFSKKNRLSFPLGRQPIDLHHLVAGGIDPAIGLHRASGRDCRCRRSTMC